MLIFGNSVMRPSTLMGSFVTFPISALFESEGVEDIFNVLIFCVDGEGVIVIVVVQGFGHFLRASV